MNREEITTQRKIGRQIFAVRMIKSESKKPISFLTKEQLAEWMDDEKETDELLDIYNSLSQHSWNMEMLSIVEEREEAFAAYIIAVYGKYYMNCVIMGCDVAQPVILEYAVKGYDCETKSNSGNPCTKFTVQDADEIFTKYVNIVLQRIEWALQQADIDVVAEILKGRMSREDIDNLRKRADAGGKIPSSFGALKKKV